MFSLKKLIKNEEPLTQGQGSPVNQELVPIDFLGNKQLINANSTPKTKR